MAKPVVEIRNWRFLQVGPRELRVHGVSENHPKGIGKEGLVTSAVIKFGDGIVETQNSIYKLVGNEDLN